MCKPKVPFRIKAIAKIEKEIDKLHKRIKRIQDKCPHKHVVKKHKCDTGNYDRTQDCYWTEFDCPDCGKHWSEDGSV